MKAQTINSDVFEFFKDTNSFVVEASELTCHDVADVIFGQLSSNKTRDRGFCIESARTGQVEEFRYVSTDKSSNGEEIYGWNFVPVNDDLRLKGVTVLVIND